MIYLDANVIIRLIEGAPHVRLPIEQYLRSSNQPFVTSQLSRLECRCKPLRIGDSALLRLYDQFFQSREMTLVAIEAAVIDCATDLRARYNLRTPDSIHLANAITSRASEFLTGDKDLSRCTEIRVTLL